MLFSMASPVSITLLTKHVPSEVAPRILGNVLAIGTVGSVLGALLAAFVLIPWVGLTSSLRIFSLACVLFAVYFFPNKLRILTVFAMAACLIIPQPDFHWESASGWTLLDQREGYYQTIRVYTDDETFVRMHLGPSYETELNLQTGKPNFKYARTMIDMVTDPSGKKILIVGGAGHTQARVLEDAGAQVTEVEIDPFVVSLSDEYFGPIRGEVVVQDGRAYIDRSSPEQYDYIFIDAFSGPDSVPPQLTTLEFFHSVRRALKPDGRMVYNFIGIPSGPRSASFQALSATISAAFEDVRISETFGERIQNIIFLASGNAITDMSYQKAPVKGRMLTDDLNPIDLARCKTALEWRTRTMLALRHKLNQPN